MLRWVSLLIALVVVAAACGGSDDGDLEAYCGLVRSGNGLISEDSNDIDPAGFDLLLEVAPPEISPAVEQLANTARDLNEIEELDQLFAAAFDPDAQAARDTFDAYAVDECGLDAAEVSEGLVERDDALDEIAAYVETNFRNESWATKVRYEVADDDDAAATSLTITFVIPADDDEPISVCQALSVWLYSVREADGSVTVVDDDLTVVERPNAAGTCVAS